MDTIAAIGMARRMPERINHLRDRFAGGPVEFLGKLPRIQEYPQNRPNMPAADPIMPRRGRFAPSPTGPLHFGSLVAALGSWLCARAAGGAWLVRIEDIDPAREVAGAAESILATLAAFGLESDEPVLRQSTCLAHHAAALRALDAAGLVYPCRCSRTDLAAYAGIHPARCPVAADVSRPPAWRLRVGSETVEFVDATCGSVSRSLRREDGDFVVWRADGWPGYQLAVVVDDAAQGITEVVRGADLLDSTPRQILLQRHLGLAQPRYRHLPLVRDAGGAKLSKQDAARPVDASAPVPALHEALRVLGQPVPQHASVPALLDAALARFDPARIPCDPLTGG
jgi:glutamyl-Q tRNA(Asp) synthetase